MTVTKLLEDLKAREAILVAELGPIQDAIKALEALPPDPPKTPATTRKKLNGATKKRKPPVKKPVEVMRDAVVKKGTEAFKIRELIDETGMSPSTAHRAMRNLLGRGIVKTADSRLGLYRYVAERDEGPARKPPLVAVPTPPSEPVPGTGRRARRKPKAAAAAPVVHGRAARA